MARSEEQASVCDWSSDVCSSDLISDQERIMIKVRGEQGISFAADGASDYKIDSNDQIFIEAAKEDLSIIKLPDRTFYSILHKKLKVGFL